MSQAYQIGKGNGERFLNRFFEEQTAKVGAVQVEAAFMFEGSVDPPLLDFPVSNDMTRKFTELAELGQDKIVLADTDRYCQDIPALALEFSS
jgi:hypothetical protein